jgi:hypothetical protein
MEDELFATKEEPKQNSNLIDALVNEPYTYENIVNNPIIKPISECDRSLRDLDDMIGKKLADIRRLQLKINAVINDAPSYQDTAFVSDLIKLAQSMDDVIKLQDIQFANTKSCIREMNGEVKKRYLIKFDDEEEPVEPTTIIPEGSIEGYLTRLINNYDEVIKGIAISIKEVFSTTAKGKDEKEKFDNATYEVYSKENDKSKKKVIGKILRMEI